MRNFLCYCFRDTHLSNAVSEVKLLKTKEQDFRKILTLRIIIYLYLIILKYYEISIFFEYCRLINSHNGLNTTMFDILNYPIIGCNVWSNNDWNYDVHVHRKSLIELRKLFSYQPFSRRIMSTAWTVESVIKKTTTILSSYIKLFIKRTNS